MEKFVLSLLALAGAEINEREQVKKKKKSSALEFQSA